MDCFRSIWMLKLLTMSKPESSTRKRALVTGSSRGIGRGIALQLASDGMDVAIHYVQNRAAAESTLEEVRKLGTDGFLIQANVRQMNEVTSIFQVVKEK